MKKTNFNQKSKKGITLIALIITIIILLILAGVALNLVVGEEGIVKRASDSKEQHEISRDKEIINLALATAQMSADYKNYNAENIQEALAGQNVTKPELVGSYTNYSYPKDQVKIAVFYDKIAPGTAFRMFYNCKNLTKIINIENLHTENMKSMGSMFNECQKLEIVNLEHFDTSNVTDMGLMFNHCYNIKSLNLNSFNTSKVTQMDFMFNICSNLQNLNINYFDTSNVIKMNNMFFNTKISELDLTSFNTSNVQNMTNMFNGNYNLKKIYVNYNFKTDSLQTSTNMFQNCLIISGGAGTTYNSSYTNATYARIDNPPDAPGYFTLKP